MIGAEERVEGQIEEFTHGVVDRPFHQGGAEAAKQGREPHGRSLSLCGGIDLQPEVKWGARRRSKRSAGSPIDDAKLIGYFLWECFGRIFVEPLGRQVIGRDSLSGAALRVGDGCRQVVVW